MREFLAEFSIVTISGAAAGSREVLSTRLEPLSDLKEASLVYQRATYSGATEDSLRSRQIIHYTLSSAALDPESVAIQPGQDNGGEGKLWPVVVMTRSGAELIPYSNLLEMRKADGTTDVTTSRSRVRQVVIGYFSEETQAKRVAEAFRGWLEHPAAAPRPAPPAGAARVKDPTRSDA